MASLFGPLISLLFGSFPQVLLFPHSCPKAKLNLSSALCNSGPSTRNAKQQFSFQFSEAGLALKPDFSFSLLLLYSSLCRNEGCRDPVSSLVSHQVTVAKTDENFILLVALAQHTNILLYFYTWKK